MKVCRVRANVTEVENPVVDSKDERIRELEQALRDVALQDTKLDSSRSDKEARKFVEEHIAVKKDRYEIPVPLKEGVDTLPDNLLMARKRLEALRGKALRDEDLRNFFTKSFCELQEAGFIESVENKNDAESLVWYLPYFVTSQAKKRIVYDGKAEFNGVCINDFLETGPDLLNSLADILARFRLGKYGMMADLTKCFFQIDLPIDQRDLFRILWFENNDLKEGKVATFRFTRHPWGIKSSPFIASYAIQKTLDENVTGASDLTRSVIRKNIYMDDVIFGVDSLDEARVIAKEAVELFESRGFKLVKWSANRESLSVLADFDKETLVSGLRELDLSREHGNELPNTKALGCVWETGEDRFKIVSSLTSLQKYTRRTMLSQLGKSFDPLGIFSPFFVKARLILQRLATEKFEWEAMVKQIKIILQRTLAASTHKPNLMELITFCSNAVRVVNERPITAISDDPRDCTAVTPASLLTPGFDTLSLVGTHHDRNHLRRDYRFNVALADHFWKDWVAFYLPALQGRNKWREVAENLKIGQLVMVGDAEDIGRRGHYRLGRVVEVLPQIYRGRPIVRRAKVAVTVHDPGTNSYKLDHIYRDISKIAPVGPVNPSNDSGGK